MAHRMADALPYGPGERDMLLMRHDLTFEYDGGARRECITAIMVDYGIPDGDSSMARTVSLPAAIGAHMILKGDITTTGVLVPVIPDIYNPVLDELATLNIECKEHTEKL